METAFPANANCDYDSKMEGPVRAGIYAIPGATREQAGASYWGIMHFGGGVQSRTVPVSTAGRSFTGEHGDGTLASDGNANVANWSGSNANAIGFRGGWFTAPEGYQHVSQRVIAGFPHAVWENAKGGRGVRTAPEE